MNKVIKTESYINICDCGKTLTMKRYVWLDEAEDVLDIFTNNSFQPGAKKKLTPKHKARSIYMAICKCGNVFLTE